MSGEHDIEVVGEDEVAEERGACGSTASGQDTGRVWGLRAGLPVPHCSGVTFRLEQVRALGVPALHWTITGRVWKFEEGLFYLTDLLGDRRRRRVWDENLVPQSSWRHPAGCACEVCRLGTA